jgi:hypothetical protein
VLQDIFDRLNETGRFCGLEINVQKSKVPNGNLTATIPNTEYGISKTTGERGIFQLFWQHAKQIMQGVSTKLNSGLPWPKLHSTKRKIFSPLNLT